LPQAGLPQQRQRQFVLEVDERQRDAVDPGGVSRSNSSTIFSGRPISGYGPLE
jgi:hypothetical protein